ncbi:MAG: hypothetical protein R3C14_43115 [Caldilineaceae bacterium]
MFITNLLVGSTVAYAGVKTLIDHRRLVQAEHTDESHSYVVSTPPIKPSSKPSSKPSAATERTRTAKEHVVAGAPTLQERRQQTAAATAMWLGIGGLFWSPLTLVGVPLTIYSSVSIFEAAGRSLYSEGKLRPSVINSILLVSTLVTDHYLPAAAISWLHHSFKQVGQRLQSTGERMATEMENEVGDLLRQAMGGAPQTVWVVRESSDAQGVEVKIPFADLKTGDILVANRGEFIPINGVVTAGEATLNLILLTRSGAPMTVSAGERVYKGAFVTEGRIRIQVDQIQSE